MEPSQDGHDSTSDTIQGGTSCIAAYFPATTSGTQPDLHRAPGCTVSRYRAASHDAALQ